MHISQPYQFTPLGAQTLTCGTAAAGTTLTMPTHPVNGATVLPLYTRIVASSGTVRYLDTGGTPSATSGMPMVTGAPSGDIDYFGNPARLRLIGVTAAGTVEVSYYG